MTRGLPSARLLVSVFGCAFASIGCIDRPIVGRQISSSTSSASSTGAGTTGGATGSATSSGGASTGTAGASGSSSGGTTTGSSSSSGTTTGAVVDDGGCLPGNVEFSSPCGTFQGCTCGLTCATDDALSFGVPGTTFCESPCTTTADCVNPAEVCRNGSCSLEYCGPFTDGGGGVPWGVCQIEDAGEGTCVPMLGPLFMSAGATFDRPDFFVCLLAGTATKTCDLAATRVDTSLRCEAGFGCNPLVAGPDGGTRGECDKGCTLQSSDTTCPAGEVCSAGSLGAAPLAQGEGFCFPAGDGGCAAGLAPQDYSSCAANFQCNCPDSCVFDVGLGQRVCEAPCSASGDCLGQGTACAGGFCGANYCVAGPAADAGGTFDGLCTSVTTDDSTCLPFSTFGSAGQIFGMCVRGGQATTACTPAWPFVFLQPFGATPPAQDVCPAGQICLADPLGGPSVCQIACDPLGSSDPGGPCTGGDICLGVDLSLPDLGICGACRQSLGICFRDGDCCSGQCAITGSSISGTCQ